MKPDVIVTWPRNNDYPIWREMIRGYRHKFGKIFIVFMNPNDNVDYSDFVRRSMTLDGVDFVISPEIPKNGDWRSVAVNEALRYSTSEWVWFTEQDFFIKDGFWEAWDNFDGDVLFADDDGRMHPCSILVKRELINKTSKNFGIVPGKLDHFGIFQKELEKMKIKKVAMKPETYYHMNGLSHNFTLVKNGEMPVYKPKDFNYYLNRCLECTVPLSPDWVLLVKDYFANIY